MDKYKKLASNTIIFAIGTFSSKILSFLLMPFVTRWRRVRCWCLHIP